MRLGMLTIAEWATDAPQCKEAHMRKPTFLTGTVSIWQVLVLNVVTLVVAGVLVVGITAAGAVSGPNAFKPSGKIRIATAASTASQLVTGAMGEQTVLSVSFNVPSGRQADIMAFFNSQITHAQPTTVGLCFNSIRLDNPTVGTILAPGQMLTLDGGVVVAGGAVHAVAAGIQAQRAGLPPGNHTLYVRAVSGGVGCRWGDRSLFVIANVR
jgi:hypothetical protein